MDPLTMNTSHTTECESYAFFRAEEDVTEEIGYPDLARCNRRAEGYLSDGTVSCICAEVPR